MVWFFDQTPLANLTCEIALRYDGKELTLRKVEMPPGRRDITETWRTDDMVRTLVEKRIRTVRKALKLPSPDS